MYKEPETLMVDFNIVATLYYARFARYVCAINDLQ